MSLALEHFRALEERSELPARLPADIASKELTKLLADTQQLALSQISSSSTRQLGSILFSHEAGLVAALSTVNAPKIKSSKAKQLKSINLLLALLGVLVGAAAISMAWKDNLLVCIISAVSIALLAAAYFMPRKDDTPEIEQSVDMKALLKLTERRMEALDRDLDAFLSVPTDTPASNDSVVNIITLANTLKKQDPDSVPDELMTSITALSIANGYEFFDYCGETEQYFDTMPTKRETRTIVPAVLKDGSLIARGMAIVSMMAASQEEN